MNALTAEVEAIRGDEFFCIVHLMANDVKLKLLKTELPDWIAEGDKVECRIQEASVSICKGAKDGDVSIENRIDAEVKSVLKGEVLSELTFMTGCGDLKSLITTDACERMEMCEGENVTLLLKAVDIKIHPLMQPLV